ncbi:MAG: hypothetical protein Q7W05_06600 [Deltaproteobacteria bacterium]|nr:hypothetical protein [Deltaproteobacteria bacterium]
MKKQNGLTFLVFVLVLFCQGNILYGGEVSKKKAWANFKPLVATKETKRLYKQGEMDSIQNKYLANVKKLLSVII